MQTLPVGEIFISYPAVVSCVYVRVCACVSPVLPEHANNLILSPIRTSAVQSNNSAIWT